MGTFDIYELFQAVQSHKSMTIAFNMRVIIVRNYDVHGT